MDASVVVLTRDLRVHDQPALAAAAAASGMVVPLFVFDDEILARFGAPNRLAFLLDSLADLRETLAGLGAPLVLRRGSVAPAVGDLVRQTGARAVHVADDVSLYATRRREGLAGICREAGAELRVHPGVTVVPPEDLTPASGDHYRVFTPYWRRWREEPRRPVLDPPRFRTPHRVDPGELPELRELSVGSPSPELPRGGERAARERLARWSGNGLDAYGERRHELDASSRLSPYLHFGCVSPLEAEAQAAGGSAGAEAFRRQLCWRDFYHQLLAASPSLPRRDYRPRGRRWSGDAEAFQAWREGRTGFPFVDAGMRQLAREGWMPNRLRLVTASFLVKDLDVDWRLGARHFFDLLVDGDLANNAGNWQWVAGTGTDPRPNRVFNPVAQGKRLDPEGDYVRRYVPELRDVPGRAVHEPWALDGELRPTLDYPEPLVDHRAAAERFLQLRLR